jgi:RHS repeat-associated protein
LIREQKITVPTVGANPGFTATQTFSYDSLNRIQSATENLTPTGGSSTQTWKQTFSIDRYGNRRFDAANTTTLGSCTASVCNPEINTSDNRLKKDQVGGSSVDYDFDANGSLIKDFNGQRFSYDAESHQKEFFSASNQTTTPDATYGYDGEGRRVKKTVGSGVTVFVYDASGQLSAEYSTTVVPQAQAKVSYLTTDHLGSPRIVTDQDGGVISRKDFTAFGEEVTSAQRVGGTNGNGYDPPVVRQDYTGYQKDNESGFEFAQARYYNASHGRFTSVDPLTASASMEDPQSFNRYAYVGNDPLTSADPSGMETCSAGYSYSECGGGGAFWGGRGGDFGDRLAEEARFYEGIPIHSQDAFDLHNERLNNVAAGYGFMTNAQAQQLIEASFWIWYDSYDESNPQSANPRFGLGATFHYSELAQPSGGLNERGRAFIKEMGRWGPVLDKTTKALMIADGIIIAAPLVADAGVSLLARAAVDKAMQAALERAAVNPRIYAQLQQQFARNGSRSIFKALRGAEKSLEEHVAKLPYPMYKSQVEGTIGNTASQIRTILKFISDYHLR